MPQGGPVCWREYTIDLIITLIGSDEWDDDDLRDESARKTMDKIMAKDTGKMSSAKLKK